VPKPIPQPAADLQGIGRLAIDAVVGVTDLVEAMHATIAASVVKPKRAANGRTDGVTGLVYRSVRGVTSLVGKGIDVAFAQLVPLFNPRETLPRREALLAALNGVLGDYLHSSGNPLALGMQLRTGGAPLSLERKALAASFPKAGGKLLVLVHGLCLGDLQWRRNEHDHGAALAASLGYTPLYLNYNTGLHVSTNGRQFAELLETLVKEWPVPVREVAIVAHSMGGLVARSACHYGTRGNHRWNRHLRKLVFLGTPHHGAPLERGGNWVNVLLEVSPYSAPFARLAKLRSAGITDLRHGSVLEEDWDSADRFAADGAAIRRMVPLPERVLCFAAAATTGKREGDLGDRLVGDGLVPVDSALGRHAKPQSALRIPRERRWIGLGMNHLDLLDRPEVYRQLKRWLASDGIDGPGFMPPKPARS